MARLLIASELDFAVQEKIRAIQVSADSLLHVINDILDFSKVEAGQLEIEVVEFDMAEVLDSAFTVLQTKAMEHPVRFDLIYPQAHLPMLKGDPSRLSEVLLNLLSNALKFTTQGGSRCAHVLWRSRSDSIEVEIVVADTGIGMTREEMDNVFQPFSQADSSISRRFGGTGLGLSISRDLVELMGGRLEVESAPGEGSTFTITLPYPVIPADDTAPAKRAESAPAVYLISESPELCSSLRSMLAYLGCDLCRVGSVPEAIDLAAVRHPNGPIILLVDRSLAKGYARGLDPDLREPMPSRFRRVLLSDAITQERVEGASVLNYPFSRYKLLNLVCSLADVPLPKALSGSMRHSRMMMLT